MTNNEFNYPPELSLFIKSILGKVAIKRIICYGSRSISKNGKCCFFMAETSDVKYGYDLLIILDDNEKLDQLTVREIPEDSNIWDDVLKLAFIVEHSNWVQTSLRDNDFFCSNVLEYGVELFNSGAPLPIPDNIDLLERTLRFRLLGWRDRFKISYGFMKAADIYISNNSLPELALFMLHQVVEQICSSLIQSFIGYNALSHNLKWLLSLLDNISPKPGEVFPQNTKEEKKLLRLLYEGYNRGRYDLRFKASVRKVRCLYHRVGYFIQVCESIFIRKENELKRTSYEKKI